MFSKTMIALSVALAFGAASGALANDIDENPSAAQSEREWAQFLGQGQKHHAETHTVNARGSYGYFGPPAQPRKESR